ncbi:MAG: hypothetical protein LWW97_00060 [Deltaproteobacteria bacterium]|nr:hypothetical protein [Deltaproteobacteria bacterium]
MEAEDQAGRRADKDYEVKTLFRDKNLLKRLKGFEVKHKMKSVEFSKEFAAGKLGDVAEWFDWLFVYEAYNKIIQQKKIIKGL